VIDRIKGCTAVEELTLQHNCITDAGLQQLCIALAGGAAPNLKKVTLADNKITVVGQNIMVGLKMMRKNIVVFFEDQYLKKK